MRVSSSRARRPRGVYIATGVGAALTAIIALALYLPLVGFLAATTASTAGLVPFPFAGVVGVTLLGLVVVAGALLLAVTRRRPWMSWTLAIIAVLVALAVTVFPLIAVAVGSADRASDIVPLLIDLWQRVTGG
ncbi:ABC-type transport system involved in multi-copper enzyme maturation permease subunit [Microbacterium proteolyticum]|uniref:ABC-type transport system involved in multi-copper enzyme maturation permease subunit n=1 Tax=Microbacterium proteolyticum TaxID=1572644 RepID=A0A7W5CIC1_9MICO|nr:MFS transporter permease [Microbacterium proteolyticum]MBB3157799.1 ABC-type transport system involved in multi-copper enzyme maturation permease subunit [Microbacterium proteolyticum]